VEQGDKEMRYQLDIPTNLSSKMEIVSVLFDTKEELTEWQDKFSDVVRKLSDFGYVVSIKEFGK